MTAACIAAVMPMHAAHMAVWRTYCFSERCLARKLSIACHVTRVACGLYPLPPLNKGCAWACPTSDTIKAILRMVQLRGTLEPVERGAQRTFVQCAGNHQDRALERSQSGRTEAVKAKPVHDGSRLNGLWVIQVGVQRLDASHAEADRGNAAPRTLEFIKACINWRACSCAVAERPPYRSTAMTR
jgi:hypothetical protein